MQSQSPVAKHSYQLWRAGGANSFQYLADARPISSMDVGLFWPTSGLIAGDKHGFAPLARLSQAFIYSPTPRVYFTSERYRPAAPPDRTR